MRCFSVFVLSHGVKPLSLCLFASAVVLLMLTISRPLRSPQEATPLVSMSPVTPCQVCLIIQSSGRWIRIRLVHVCISFSDASHLCFEPDVCGPSPGPSSCHMTADQAQEDRDSVQQIIDKYSRELSASLRHAGGTAGKRLDGLFCICKTWTRLTDAWNRFLKTQC